MILVEVTGDLIKTFVLDLCEALDRAGGFLKDDNLFHENKIEDAARFDRVSCHKVHCVTVVVDFVTKINMTDFCNVLFLDIKLYFLY
jgi:hypothetical protein